MKKLVLTLCLVVTATAALAQGTVKFANTSTSLVSSDGTTIPAGAGSYYFGLLTAAAGTTDPLQFTFAGVYGTNTVLGRFQGGPNTGVGVPGWAVNTTRSYLFAGWSANMGATFNPAWMQPGFLAPSAGWFFGTSTIGTGTSGGVDANNTSWPVMVPFGISAGQIGAGWNLSPVPVPEPTTLALAGLGAAALLIFRRRN